MKIHTSEPAGDILGFLTGQEEVDLAVSLLQEHGQPLENCKKHFIYIILVVLVVNSYYDSALGQTL